MTTAQGENKRLSQRQGQTLEGSEALVQPGKEGSLEAIRRKGNWPPCRCIGRLSQDGQAWVWGRSQPTSLVGGTTEALHMGGTQWHGTVRASPDTLTALTFASPLLTPFHHHHDSLLENATLFKPW